MPDIEIELYDAEAIGDEPTSGFEWEDARAARNDLWDAEPSRQQMLRAIKQHPLGNITRRFAVAAVLRARRNRLEQSPNRQIK